MIYFMHVIGACAQQSHTNLHMMRLQHIDLHNVCKLTPQVSALQINVSGRQRPKFCLRLKSGLCSQDDMAGGSMRCVGRSLLLYGARSSARGACHGNAR